MKNQGNKVCTPGLLVSDALAAMLISADVVASPIIINSASYHEWREVNRLGEVISEMGVVMDIDGLPLNQDDIPIYVAGIDSNITRDSYPDGLLSEHDFNSFFSVYHDGSDLSEWMLDFRFSYKISAEAFGDSDVEIVMHEGDTVRRVCSDSSICPSSFEGVQEFSVLLSSGEEFGAWYSVSLKGDAGLFEGEGQFDAEVTYLLELVGAVVVAPSQVPEPSSLLLSGLGLAGLGFYRRRESHRRSAA